MQVYKSFKIAGIAYYEALFVIEELKIGARLRLEAEENKHDEHAVAIYYNERKLGYIPRMYNYSIGRILRAGWNIFDAYVQKIDRDNLEIEEVALFVRENGEGVR